MANHREVFIKTKDFARAHLFPVRKKADGKRNKKAVPSSEAQEKYNSKCRENYLADLLHLNFTPDDISLRLSYDTDPVTIEEALKNVQLFLRRVKNYRSKYGMSKIKYIYVTEMGIKSGHIHHHVVMSGGVERDVLEALWGRGFSNTQRLQFTEDGLRGMAHYFGNYPEKERTTFRRWNSSKGLEKPAAKQNDYRISKKNANYINEHPDDLNFIEQFYPDYHITKVETTPKSGFSAGIFVTLYMYRKDAEFLWSRGTGKRTTTGRNDVNKNAHKRI